MQLNNIFVDTLTNAHPLYTNEYRLLSMYLAAISMLYFIVTLYFWSFKKRCTSFTGYKYIYISFWFLLSVGMLAFCLLDLLEKGSLINFVILLGSLSLIALFDEKELFIFTAFAFLAVLFLVIALKKDVCLIQHSFLMSICAIIISRILDYSYVKSLVLQKRLKECTETDVLTGLLNRRGLDNWIEINKPKSPDSRYNYAIGIVDIDDFKYFNDEYGHLCGDKCLKVVAACLKSYFNKEHCAVSRFGGEEFVVLIRNINEDAAFKEFVKFKKVVENTKVYLDNKPGYKRVTVSIGVAFDEAIGKADFNKMFKRADNALYMAKKDGKNLVVFNKDESYR